MQYYALYHNYMMMTNCFGRVYRTKLRKTIEKIRAIWYTILVILYIDGFAYKAEVDCEGKLQKTVEIAY